MTQTWYEVHEGAISPRDNTVSWRGWGMYATKREAEDAAKKLKQPCRIVYVELVKEYGL